MERVVRVVLAAAIVATLAAGLTLARGAGDSAAQPISGCRNKATGALRVLDVAADQACTPDEEELNWNREGPQGPEGQGGGGASEQQLWLYGGGVLYSADCPAYAFVGHIPGACSDKPDEGATQNAVSIDGGRYPSSAKARLEAAVNVDPNATVCLRLYDLTAAEPLPASETCDTSVAGAIWATHARQLSTPFDLADKEHEYALQLQATRHGPCGGGAPAASVPPSPKAYPSISPSTVPPIVPLAGEAPTVSPAPGQVGEPGPGPNEVAPSPAASAATPPLPPGSGGECGFSSLVRARLIIDW